MKYKFDIDALSLKLDSIHNELDEVGIIGYTELALWVMLICKDKRRVKAEILWDLFTKEN